MLVSIRQSSFDRVSGQVPSVETFKQFVYFFTANSVALPVFSCKNEGEIIAILAIHDFY